MKIKVGDIYEIYSMWGNHKKKVKVTKILATDDKSDYLITYRECGFIGDKDTVTGTRFKQDIYRRVLEAEI